MKEPAFAHFESALARLITIYQRFHIDLMRIERRYMDAPTSLLEHEIMELTGRLKGLKDGIRVIEESRADNLLPLNLPQITV